MSTTPILDLEQAPPKPPGRTRPMLIGLAIGLVGPWLWALGTEILLSRWQWPAFNPLLLIPALYVAIAIHEAGHFVAGKLAGLDAGGIAVGALVFVKSGRNWVFRFEPRSWLAGFLVPHAGLSESSPSKYKWLLAGGPFASVLLAVLSWVYWTQRGDGVWHWAGTLSWGSLFLAVMSVIPFASGAVKSDVARLWQFVRHPEGAQRWMALLSLQTEEARGTRPREWTGELLQQTLAIGAGSGEYAHCQLLGYYRRLDEGQDEAALEHLENALRKSARSGKAMRHALFLEAAWASAHIRKNAPQACSWRDRACTLQKPGSLGAVEGAIAMCEGRYEDAERHWQEVRAYVDRRKLDSGLIRFAKERWAGFEAACRAARSSTPGATSESA